MRCFLGLRGAHSWRNSWMLTVNEYLWIRLQLLFCLTVVASEWSRRRMRFPFFSLYPFFLWIYLSLFSIFHSVQYLHPFGECLWVYYMLVTFFFSQQLEMEDGDEIDAMLHQTGGAIDGRFWIVWWICDN